MNRLEPLALLTKNKTAVLSDVVANLLDHQEAINTAQEVIEEYTEYLNSMYLPLAAYTNKQLMTRARATLMGDTATLAIIEAEARQELLDGISKRKEIIEEYGDYINANHALITKLSLEAKENLGQILTLCKPQEEEKGQYAVAMICERPNARVPFL